MTDFAVPRRPAMAMPPRPVQTNIVNLSVVHENQPWKAGV